VSGKGTMTQGGSLGHCVWQGEGHLRSQGVARFDVQGVARFDVRWRRTIALRV
jgi:hypothetical protein